MKAKIMGLVAVMAVCGVALRGLAEHHEHDHKHEHEHEHKHEHEHEHEHDHEHEHEHEHAHGQSVEVSASAERSIALKTVRAAKRKMSATVTLLGRIELSPDARSEAPTPVAGRLTLKVRPLQAVKKGDVLFVVDSPDLRTRAREIAVLEKRLQVYRGLKRTNAELEAQLQIKQAERVTMLAGAEEHDGVATVCASADGMVDALAVRDGAWVEPGSAVVQLVRTGDVRFRALVAASEAARLRDGMTATIGETSGRIRLGLGDESGMTPVYALFPEGTLAARPGERARLECVTGDGHEERAVPSACIVRIGLEPTVFVRDEHDRDRFLAVKVETGVSSGGWTAVKGLPDDDDLEIVQEGAYELKLALAAQAGSRPAGHFHADGTFHEGQD